MPRLLHTADWQIGRQYGRFESEDAALLSNERLEVIRRIAQLATDRNVDAVLVAGDLFDLQTVSDKLLRRTFSALDAFSGPWIAIPGNHDAALAASVWTHADQLGVIPANFHLLDQPIVAAFKDLNFAVLPAPLTQRQVAQDLTDWFDTEETVPGLVRIGLAHGSVSGRLGDIAAQHNPIAHDRTETARLDYLALGDWHGFLKVSERCAYSGTPEPDGFRSVDPGFVLEVDIAAAGAPPQLTPHRVGRFDWHRTVPNVELLPDLDALIDQLAALGENDVLRCRPTGALSIANRQRLEQCAAQALAASAASEIDLSQLVVAPSESDLAHLQADGYVGQVLNDLRAQLQNLSSDDSAHPANQTTNDALVLLTEVLGQSGSGARGVSAENKAGSA
jgi:3',5'-cyclic AMP phosphodiesterase CpdA